MNINFISFKKMAICAAAVMALASTGVSAKDKVATPDGFEHILIYLGTGVFDPMNPTPRPGFVNCAGLFCDGEYFQKEIMHRTDADIAVLADKAKAFYLQRFGLDVDYLLAQGRVAFDLFAVNPDFEYRVQIATGKGANSEGWIIRDGGYRLLILDPNGIDMAGEFEGQHADPLNAMFFGDYNILVTDKRNRPVDELIIHYQANEPAVIHANGSMDFRCEMISEKLGTGLGSGTLMLSTLSNGHIRGNGRNVLTFPGVSTLAEFPAYPPYDARPTRKGKEYKR